MSRKELGVRLPYLPDSDLRLTHHLYPADRRLGHTVVVTSLANRLLSFLLLLEFENGQSSQWTNWKVLIPEVLPFCLEKISTSRLIPMSQREADSASAKELGDVLPVSEVFLTE